MEIYKSLCYNNYMDKTKLNAFKDSTASPMHLRACIGNNTGVSVAERDTSISEGFRDVVDLCYKNIDNQKYTYTFQQAN